MKKPKRKKSDLPRRSEAKAGVEIIRKAAERSAKGLPRRSTAKAGVRFPKPKVAVRRGFKRG
jgi:hypothetical protein